MQVDTADGRALVAHRHWIVALAFSPGGKKVASLDRGGFLVLWAVDEGAQITWKDAPGATAMAFIPSGELLVSEAAGLTRRNGTTLEVRAHASNVKPSWLEVGGGGRWVLGDQCVYDAESLAFRAIARARDVAFVNWRHGAADATGDAVLLCDDGGFDDDGQFGHAPLRDPHLTLFDVDLKTSRRWRAMTEGRVVATAFDASSKRFVFATSDGEIVAWSSDGASEAVVGHASDVETLFCFGDASAALLRGKDGPPRLAWWSGLFEGTPIELTLPDTQLAVLSADGRWLVWAERSFELRLFDLGRLGLPRKAAGTPPVSPAHLRALGIAWPTDPEIAKARAREGVRIDLDATLARLESSLAFVAREIAAIHKTARELRAPVEDVSDRREALGERRVALTKAVAALGRVRGAVIAHVAKAPLPDVDESEAGDPLAALRRAVLSSPDDVAPRLAYARALPDDDVHARLILAQCEVLDLPSWRPRRKLLELRARSIVYDHERELTHLVAPYCESASFGRGFVSTLRVDAFDFPRHADAVFDLEPVRGLAISEYGADLATCPALARIRELSCTRVDMTALAASKHAGALERLSVDDSKSTPYDEAKWFAIAAGSGALRSLEELALWNANGAPNGLRALARGSGLPALRKLLVRGRSLGVETLAALASSPLARRLRELSLELRSDEETRAFASASFASLESLELSASFRGCSLVELATLDAPRLVSLDLSSFGCEVTAVSALAVRDFEHLRAVKLSATDLDGDGIRALAEAPWLGRLETLELRLGPKLAARDLEPLLCRLGAPLRRLAISLRDSRGIGRELARSPAAEHVVSLSVLDLERADELAPILDTAKSLRGVELGSQKAAKAGLRALRAAGFRELSGSVGTFVRESEFEAESSWAEQSK